MEYIKGLSRRDKGKREILTDRNHTLVHLVDGEKMWQSKTLTSAGIRTLKAQCSEGLENLLRDSHETIAIEPSRLFV